MEQYAEVVLDLEGNAVQGAAVQVRLPNGTPAKIYDASGAEQPNPIATGPQGDFAFQAANGKYVLQVTVRGSVYKTVGPLTFYDPADDTDRLTSGDLSDSGAAARIGYAPGGASAVEGSVEDRLRQVVLLWDYLSDAQRADVTNRIGALDCTAALQAAIDYGASLYSDSGGYGSGGIVLQLPPGKIRFTEILRKNGVSLSGYGRYRTLLLMSKNGGTGFRSAAATTQTSAGNVYWLEDSDFSMVPNPAVTFTLPTTLWNMIGFSRTTWRNIGLCFTANVSAVTVLGATTAGDGGPAQWYNAFYDVFVEGVGSGGVAWDLGDPRADREQITTWNWYGGRTSGGAAIGMRLNSATGCNLYGHCFEGLTTELIIGNPSGSRGCQNVNLFGCYFEGGAGGYLIHPNAVATSIFGGFSTGVTHIDNGTRTSIMNDGEYKMQVANGEDSWQLVQANASQKAKVSGSTQPGFQLKNSAGNFVEIMNNAAFSSGSSFFQVSDSIGRDLIKAGSSSTQVYGTAFYFGNQSSVGIFIGSGSPEGVVAAGVGSIYMRTNGGAGTTTYVKESGGTTANGWVGK